MSMTIHIGSQNDTFMTNDRVATNSKVNDKSEKSNRTTLFAGDIGLGPDSIQFKREQAQKKALKIVGDTFSSEKELDQNVSDLMDQRQKLQDQNVDNIQMLHEIDASKKERMDSYQVTENSPENQDLELLRKEKLSGKAGLDIELTDAETKRLAEIHSEGITDYQRDMLELDDKEEIYQGYIDDNNSSLKGISSSLSGIQISRLKSAPMLDASKESQEILDAANKDVIGELISESKDHIDDKVEEEKDKADDIKEEKEEKEEKTDSKESSENVKEDQQEDMIENASIDKPKVEKKLEEILDDMNLIEEDLKGAAVDTGI